MSLRALLNVLLFALHTSAQCWNFAYGPTDGSTCYSDPFSHSYLQVFIIDDHLDPNCHSGTNVFAYVTYTDIFEVVHVNEPAIKTWVFEDDTGPSATFPLSFPVAFSTIKDGSEVTVTVLASSPPALPTMTCEFSFAVQATSIALATRTTSQTLTLISSSTISKSRFSKGRTVHRRGILETVLTESIISHNEYSGSHRPADLGAISSDQDRQRLQNSDGTASNTNSNLNHHPRRLDRHLSQHHHPNNNLDLPPLPRHSSLGRLSRGEAHRSNAAPRRNLVLPNMRPRGNPPRPADIHRRRGRREHHLDDGHQHAGGVYQPHDRGDHGAAGADHVHFGHRHENVHAACAGGDAVDGAEFADGGRGCVFDGRDYGVAAGRGDAEVHPVGRGGV